ncbi:TetR/AcrR family transcriptional regulator [Paludibacterium yongneupense]|uniref:TetR/AcrR family transcriptional regulator n=1 Tax=Paludibacterium yongneupense TaxID=400061 RepID=UPI00068491AE|nr:TetR/AcrR family transcriptional regulator [Paludibacterium yongneupense]
MPTKRQPDSLKPRKKPVQARSADTVEIILEAAARILELEGFASYNTNAIASRAGISIGSYYQYFPNKDAVTAALIKRDSEDLAAHLLQAGQARTWQQGLKLAIDAAVAHQLRRPVLARRLDMAERHLLPDGGQAAVSAIACATIRQLLQMPDAPKISDTGSLCADIVAIAQGLIDAAGARGETDPLSLSERVERAVLAFIAASPPDRDDRQPKGLDNPDGMTSPTLST